MSHKFTVLSALAIVNILFSYSSPAIDTPFFVENLFSPVYIFSSEEEHKKWINSSTLNRWW
jgi:hypothetical protein